ncbi:2-amino-4-hydroxy-6-hydroxymethyldihydropteridine diphosphokinase [Sphingomonas sp. CGMCC 1.13654]|uniref:2-amino-4-hydroxy-6-hydroxymethyldihydropteridine pyrophosphokinase n=1 Tax=Sphingomonas chungangi TaxID=2683589 RepID=A0A838L871_9SPHN|nr:2-amino-4-hydroxy-6-hydroxymethyldihydropteridine diphosphokinase [Sphingomonas chungangi]MBA2935110.1 2-amino-4-hydroxy-6-hydroxymethyldihydropteridine diphosphokinase [Sphingomonas chungangi]MVW54226.1 2-amino-4-hydroxy-6-hydroxymethyldihydropteridine diphosphokinase [Sphingomonas chungangi]
MVTASYVIGLGSNRRHGRYGAPERVIRSAIDALAAKGLVVGRVSRIVRTPAMGPSDRDFANAAVLVETDLAPPALLALLQRTERDFGRRRYRRWGARVLDLDILAWSGAHWSDRRLIVPHPGLAIRDFALGPAAQITPRWRHPALNRTLRQLHAQLRKPRPVDRTRRTP